MHKRHSFHLRRLSLFGVLVLSLFAVRFDASHQLAFDGATPKILSYSTEMSRYGLLSGNNSARAANGLGPLVIDAQLNNAAQAKAQHMADQNYWAHIAPDGTQPWYFFDQAGYGYVRAGENLAYGFMTSQGATDGWMASPGHKANILGDYVDVGYGIVNASNYLGEGEQTIVVAHYGSRGGSAPPLSQPEPTPAPTPAPQTTSTPPSQPTPSTPSPTPAAEQTSPTPTATPKPTATSTKPTDKDETEPAPVQTGDESDQSLLTLLSQKRAPILALSALAIISMTIMGYALTHRVAFHHALATGERYVLTHPSIDTVAVIATIVAVLLTSYGTIR